MRLPQELMKEGSHGIRKVQKD